MSNIQTQLENLSVVSKKLNESSDSINLIIEGFEAKLKELNLGVIATVEGLGFQEPVDEDENEEVVDGDRFLGYGPLPDGKFVGKWRLCVLWDSDETSFTIAGYPRTTPNILIEANRSTRIQAIRLLPKLLDALRVKAEKMIEDIAEAKKPYGAEED